MIDSSQTVPSLVEGASRRRAPAPSSRCVIGRLVGLVGSVAATCWLVGCASTSAPLDDGRLIRRQIAERMGAAWADQVELPFEVDDEVDAVLAAKLKPVGDEGSRVARVLDYIFRSLDLQYELTPTRDASGTFRSRRGNCLSFVNLFVAAGRRLRINPIYVEVEDYQRWDHRQGMVVSQGHIVGGVYVAGELRTYDFLPYRVKSYKDFEPIDDLTATAHYYNNMGAEALLSDDFAAAKTFLETAVAVDPSFVKASNNLGVWHARNGELETAITTYLQALEREPGDVPLLTNLARAYQQQGRLEDAEAALSQIEGVQHNNPFFFVYRGEVALADGRHEDALRYMRDALRVDTEAPEVHIGLTKVYFALGELKKARHHLQRALRLDATHPEARKLLYMLDPLLNGAEPDADPDDAASAGDPGGAEGSE